VIIPRGGTVDLIVVGQLSGSTPHLTTFAASIQSERSQTRGLRTGTILAFSGDNGMGSAVRTTILDADEVYAISANPVRAAPLIITMREQAKRIDIYDFAGRRVRRIIPAVGEESIHWDLETDDARPVANGAYVIVLDLPSGLVRQTIFILR
jgi:hypothetical protein